MKRIIPIAILLIAVVSIFVWYYQSNKSNQQTVSNDVLSEVVEESILLYPESGEVLFKYTPNDEFMKATNSPTVIANQSIVRTNIGKASVLLPDNSSISLSDNTEITVNYTKESISVYQTLGETYHRVEALVSGKTYQVQTAGTLAAVRGTKFAVKYDNKNKKTKIAVTENKVEVSTISKTEGTTVPPSEESMMLEEGKTVSVVEVVKIAPQRFSSMKVMDTVNDAEMRVFVSEQKNVDIKLEKIKKETPNRNEMRKEMKRVIFKDRGEVKSDKEEASVNEPPVVNKTVEIKPTTVIKPSVEETTIVEREVIPTPTPTPPTITDTTSNNTVSTIVTEPSVVTKVGEEEFFNAFEPLFIKHFYVDDIDTPCTTKVTPEESVRIVTSYAQSKGYPFTKTTLLSFAQAIDAYCARKDPDTKVKLQSRFNVEYPF
ncbi:FecR family protein [Candidatus Gracilibacteria bacterium]|nr:FecR family protein [Candidatus Gracilibacteria bacterium]MCF7898941.1 FecR family protein [Candidatus Paceibacterota bacterium]